MMKMKDNHLDGGSLSNEQKPPKKCESSLSELNLNDFRKYPRSLSKSYVKTFCSQVRTLSYTQLLTTCFSKCLSELQVHASNEQIEEWVCLIHACMSGKGRNYHGVEHVFDISLGGDSILVLSAMFHDAVYFSLDGGINSTNSKYIADVIRTEDPGGSLKICNLEEKGDELLSMVASVFGFHSGQTLEPFGGLNEFLSAVMAVRALSSVLDKTVLLEIVACIEGTIPFRKNNAEGHTPFDQLYMRLLETNKIFGLNLSDSFIMESTKRAVDLAHRDVGNFQSSEIAEFVDNTWKLLPESNIPLQKNTPYLLSEFHKALEKTFNFLSNLDISTIFYSFEDYPEPVTVQSMSVRAKYNVTTTCRYAEIKILAVSVIEAIAVLTGGDAPICLFLGDLPSPNNLTPSLEEYLPPIEKKMKLEGSDDVFRLLWHGRSSETIFDIRNSPVGAYLYQSLGDDGANRCRQHIECPMRKEKSVKLLQSIPRQVALDILDACAYFANIRYQSINKLRKEVEKWRDDDDDNDNNSER